MFRRAIAAVAASAVVLGGLTFGAVPAGAAITGSASINPSVFEPGSSPEVLVTWTESSAAATTSPGNGAFADPTGGNYLSVEVGWGWTFSKRNPTNTAVSYTATWVPATAPATGGSYECRDGGTTFASFASSGFGISSGTTLACLVRRSSNSSDNPGQQVVLSNTGSAHFTLTGNSSITVTFPASTVTAPASGPASDTWRIISLGTTTNSSTLIANNQTTTVRTNVPSPDGTIVTVPSVTIDFDGNGGTCSPAFVTGEQGTWGTALTADKCTNGSRQLAFFSTSPTAALGATNVRPGGPIYFLEPNRLYAIWAPDKPSPVTDVVATPGLNSVKVTWKAPVSDGGDPINSYCVALRTEQNPNPFPRCSSAAEPLERTVNLPATNSKYTFTVFARNSAGSSELVAGAPVSPYDIKGVTASRKDVLLGLGGTQVEARGDAPGLAGQSLNVEYKVGAGQWTTQANAVSVDAKSNFRWSKKFPRSSNKNAVTVRFSYGTDAVVGPLVLTRGGEAGDLSAPRNIKVDNRPNKINVTWDRPKFDGGATITGYTLCATPGDGIGGRICRSETGTEGIFWNLNTRQTYTFTVSAKTSTREGPRGKYSKSVDPTDASIRGAARSFDELTADVRGAGFKENSRFRVEMAIPVPGVNSDRWDWDQVTSFREDQESFARSLRIPLDASVRGERLVLRLITPTGTVSSRFIRP